MNRDGAHGSRIGGISGTGKTGAFSVIITKHYDGLDEDNGSSLFYSGGGSAKNTNPDQIAESAGTKALQYSCKVQPHQHVRVFRGAIRTDELYPRIGFRYDGLYEVVSEIRGHNELGGAFVKFLLRGVPGEHQVIRTPQRRPTPEEKTMMARFSTEF
jgi:SAD/SRA domain